jgi:hypothetical protein
MLTTTQPSSPFYAVRVGFVLVGGSATGQIFVSVRNVYTLGSNIISPVSLTSFSTTSSAMNIYGYSSGQIADIMDVYTYSGGTKAWSVANNGAVTSAVSETSPMFISSVGSNVPSNGMYSSSANTLSFATASTNALTILSNQYVGIGGSPSVPLDVINVTPIIRAVSTGTGSNVTTAYLSMVGNRTGIGGPIAEIQFGNTEGQSSVQTYSMSRIRAWHDQVGTQDLGFETATAGGVAGSAERMRIFASGGVSIGTLTDPGLANLYVNGIIGVGVTPTFWSIPAVDMGATGGVSGYSGGVGTHANAYYNGTNWIYKTSSYAGLYLNNAGTHQWYIAPSGTAGNTVSWTEAMLLDTGGNLNVIGNITTNGIATAKTANPILFTSSGTYTPSANAKVIQVIVCGGGGGGGGGALTASGTACSGGSGGGSGALVSALFKVSDILLGSAIGNLFPTSSPNWTLGSGATITSASVVSPDGALDASTITGISGSSDVYTAYPNGSGTFTAWVYLQAGTSTSVTLQMSASGNGYNAVYNLSTGIAGSPAITGTGGTISSVSSSMTSVGGGWYRCQLTFTTSGSVNNFIILPGTGTIYAWGAQLISGSSFYSSPTVTIGAAGAGGAASTTSSTAGSAGGVGGGSLFGTLLSAYGGGGGAGGQININSGGGGGGGWGSAGSTGTSAAGGNGGSGGGQIGGYGGTGGSGIYGGYGGGGGVNGAAGSTGGFSYNTVAVSSSGGGSGAGIAATPVALGGGNSILPLGYVTAFGGVGGIAGGNAKYSSAITIASGGAGGGSNTTGTAGTGGYGFNGSGGGGGGSNLNTFTAGAGGAGGAGFVLVVEYF